MYYSSLWLDPAECPTVCLINFKVLMREKQRLDVITWHKFKLLCLQKHFLLINKYMFQNCLPETTEGDTPPPNPHPLLSSHPPSFPPCLWNTHTLTLSCTHPRILTLYLSTPLHAATTHAGIQCAQETDRVEGTHCFPQLHSSLESLHHLPPTNTSSSSSSQSV